MRPELAPRRFVLSIRQRLLLILVGTGFALMAAHDAIAYLEVRRSALATARGTLDDVATQMSDLLGMSAEQIRRQAVAAAHDPGVRSILRAPATARTPGDVAAALRRFGGQAGPVEVWDLRGRPVASTADAPLTADSSARRQVIEGVPPTDSVAIGPVRAFADTVRFSVIATVADGTDMLGYLVQWRRLSGGNQPGNAQLLKLLGAGAKLSLGNTRGGGWTDFSRSVEPPPLTLPAPGLLAYMRNETGAQLAVARGVRATPWTLLVEVPRARVFAPVREVVRRLAATSAVLLVLGATLVWLLGRRLTTPLSDLAAAAAGISAGDYSRRVSVGVPDEVGMLAGAFNAMAENVAATQARLQAHTQEIERQAEELSDQATELEAANHDLLDAVRDADNARARAEAAESEQRASAQRYRQLFDVNPMPMWIYDRQSLRFLDVNEAAVRQYGFAREEFLAMTVADIRPPEDAATLRDAVAGPPRGLHRQGGWRHRKKDGTLIDVEIIGHSLVANGRDAELILAHDVTERLRAEAELRETTDILQAVVDDSPLAIISVTPELDVMRWNPAAERLLGWTAGEMLGNPYRQIVPEERLAESRGVQASMLRDEPVTGIETQRRRKDGSLVDVSLSVAPLHDAAGNVTGGLAILADITERKQLEAQFRQAQKMEAVGQLAGGVAHDFNNMLTAIASFSEFAAAELPAGSRARSDLEQVQEATRRAAALTRQLLAFSRQQVLQPRVLDVNEIVGGLVPMLRRVIGDDIKLAMKLAGQLWLTTVDPGQLEQVIVNLVVNARDAMPDGGSLVLETANVDLDESYARRGPHGGTSGPHVMLAVTDTGVGMDTETQARIFEPFFTTKPVGRGTGLGLSMVYGVVKQTGASIWVYSEPERGSTFKIYLPRTADERTVAEASRLAGPRQPLRRAVVLLVEDDPNVRAVARRTLEREGLCVLEARDGVEALEASVRTPEPIELVLTDLVMPEMGGRELARRLEERGHAARVIFMSGYTADAVNRQSILAPNDVFLEKPFTPDGLVRKVRDALSRSAA
jgi:PAS domain S-box-containing protein